MRQAACIWAKIEREKLSRSRQSALNCGHSSLKKALKMPALPEPDHLKV
jgi:hypothetical protein